jgi:hypothetical protein
MEHLRFPVGKFSAPAVFDKSVLDKHIKVIAALPDLIFSKIGIIEDEDYYFTYRPEGWNVIKVINHLSDSHMQAFSRFKLALTEDNPTIKPYLEDKWVQLSDTSLESVDDALGILHHVHAKWIKLMAGMSSADFHRTYFHPEQQKTAELYKIAAMYAWHSDHHSAHIDLALKQRGKF